MTQLNEEVLPVVWSLARRELVVRPDSTVDEAIGYLRRQARGRLETIYYVYVLDEQQRLLGVVSFRELFSMDPSQRIRDIMHTDIVTVQDDQHQEAVSRVFAQHGLAAVPVVDHDGRMKGIVTLDDIVDVVQEEATEDIQKVGGMEALGAPYLFTARAARRFQDVAYANPAVLIFGRESVGLDPQILARHAAETVAIPMRDPALRSLNLSTSVALALYEVRRQWGWTTRARD